MEAVQRDYWYFVALIFLPFLKVAVQEKETLTVRLEEGMVLGCLCPWDGNLSMVSWTKLPDKNPVAVFHPDYGVAFSHHYRERVEFLRTTPMDGSISLRNVTHQDIGVYHCSVQTFPQGPWTRNIQVEDLDEPPEEDESTEPPPPPVVTVADRELVAEQNNNLTIACNHQHNGSVDQVILEKMLHGQPWGIIGVCKKVEGGLVSEDYSERGRVNCADSLDISLHLTEVEQGDSGYYRCTFNTDTGVQIITVQLSVAVPEGFSLSLYMMYIYIGAGVAGLLLLTVILILAVRHRKKARREEYRVKLHPSQRQSSSSPEMEAVAEAVMDVRAIPLGNQTNVDKIEMWDVKGGQCSLESQVFAVILPSCCSRRNSRSCSCTFDCDDTCDAACVTTETDVRS